jgi:hypothetical protein
VLQARPKVAADERDDVDDLARRAVGIQGCLEAAQAEEVEPEVGLAERDDLCPPSAASISPRAW